MKNNKVNFNEKNVFNVAMREWLYLNMLNEQLQTFQAIDKLSSDCKDQNEFRSKSLFKPKK